MEPLFAVAEQFSSSGYVRDIAEIGCGNINRTFLVTLEQAPEKHFILQRINTRVFRNPEIVMQNMRTVTEHAHRKLQKPSLGEGRRWRLPRVLSTKPGRDYFIDGEGSFWRAISYIDNAQSFDTITGLKHAREVGYCLGMFHLLLSDLPPEKLADPLRGFHDTSMYLRRYDEVVATYKEGATPEMQYCLDFVGAHRGWVDVLENERKNGGLQPRLVHGDPKINNIMIDNDTGHAVSIVDLDTVRPALVHYDIGDCLRSGCNSLGEETMQWEDVTFDIKLCQAVLEGYLSQARHFLNDKDYKYLFDAIRLIAFELGLRFFTDFLAGDVYFKTTYPQHNLYRALVQFKLAESIDAQEANIRKVIQGMR